MRLLLGITGVLLYVLFYILQSNLNSPILRSILFILSIIPVTLMAFLFVDNINELKDVKKFASFVTLLIIMTFIGFAYQRTTSKETIVELVLFAIFAWALSFLTGRIPRT